MNQSGLVRVGVVLAGLVALILGAVYAWNMREASGPSEEELVHRAAEWLSESDPRIEGVLPPPMAQGEAAFSEDEVAVYWADQVLRQKGVKVVKVERLKGGEWKLETKSHFLLGPARVREKSGRVISPHLSLHNPDIFVKVRDGKLVPVRVD